MKIERKVFINRANGQGSITIPSKILKDLAKANGKYPKRISFEILNSKSKVGDIKLNAIPK